MPPLPRKASSAIRQQIVAALGDPARRRLDRNGSSRSYLDLWGIRESALFNDLANALEESTKLFTKEKTFPNQSQRYQCVLSYPEAPEFDAILVHVTLSPVGQPPRVKIAVHPSDTTQTLPTILID